MQLTGQGDKDEGGCSRNQCFSHLSNYHQPSAAATSNERPPSNPSKASPIVAPDHVTVEVSQLLSSECKWCA